MTGCPPRELGAAVGGGVRGLGSGAVGCAGMGWVCGVAVVFGGVFWGEGPWLALGCRHFRTGAVVGTGVPVLGSGGCDALWGTWSGERGLRL